jgi:hypothetical protein
VLNANASYVDHGKRNLKVNAQLTVSALYTWLERSGPELLMRRDDPYQHLKSDLRDETSEPRHKNVTDCLGVVATVEITLHYDGE